MSRRLQLVAFRGHPQRPAGFGHLRDVQPADALDQERFRHRSEVVEAERSGLRHPVLDVELHFGRAWGDTGQAEACPITRDTGRASTTLEAFAKAHIAGLLLG